METIEIREARGEDAKALLAYIRRIGGESDNLTFDGNGFPITEEQEAGFLENTHSAKRSIILIALNSKVEFWTYDEGLCVQCMHVGSYDDEPATVSLMHEYMEQQGYVLDITDQRLHHEIYLSDARKVAPEKLKTVLRHPIRKAI